MNREVKLRLATFTFGPLTGAALEDFHAEVKAYFEIKSLDAMTPEQTRAIITLSAEAARRGGWTGTRGEFREQVQLPDLPGLLAALGEALGFGEVAASPGEAARPESCPKPGTSSGA